MAENYEFETHDMTWSGGSVPDYAFYLNDENMNKQVGTQLQNVDTVVGEKKLKHVCWILT